MADPITMGTGHPAECVCSKCVPPGPDGQREVCVEIRIQYGSIVYHPINDTAKALAEIAGTKTLTRAALKIACERLGMKVSMQESEAVAADRREFEGGE